MISRTVPLPFATELSKPATASPRRTQKMGLIRMAGCWWTVMTWRSWGRRYLFTAAGTVSVFGASLIANAYPDRRDKGRNPVCGRRQEGADVVYHVGRGGGLYQYPPHNECDSGPSEDCLQIHVASHRRRACPSFQRTYASLSRFRGQR